MNCITAQVAGGIAHVALNRAAKRNALDAATIEALTQELLRCADDAAVRVVQLTGAGEVFCAGVDLVEMQAQRDASEPDNLAHALKLSRLLGVLDSLPKPTLARVNGDGYGGALGLIGACDIVVVADGGIAQGADGEAFFVEILAEHGLVKGDEGGLGVRRHVLRRGRRGWRGQRHRGRDRPHRARRRKRREALRRIHRRSRAHGARRRK